MTLAAAIICFVLGWACCEAFSWPRRIERAYNQGQADRDQTWREAIRIREKAEGS